MPTDDPPRTAQKCAKCGERTDYLTSIPRFGETPTYNIFRCVTCGYVNWIAEQIGGAGSI